MHKILQELLVLQNRDSTLQKMEAEMRQIPLDVEKEKQKLKLDQSNLEAEKTKLKELEVKANQLRLERRTRQDTVERLKVQMYETSKEDEIAALGSEVTRYEQAVDDYETEELEVLEAVDEQKVVVKAAENSLEQRKQYVQESIGSLTEKARTMVGRFKEAKVARQKASEGIDAEALVLYERILKAKSELAVVEWRNGTCSGCDMKVVASTSAAVKADKELVQCENCGRILYEV